MPVWNYSFAEDATARHAYGELLRQGIYVPLTRYGAGQTGSYLRIAVNSEHSAEDLQRLREALTIACPWGQS